MAPKYTQIRFSIGISSEGNHQQEGYKSLWQKLVLSFGVFFFGKSQLFLFFVLLLRERILRIVGELFSPRLFFCLFVFEIFLGGNGKSFGCPRFYPWVPWSPTLATLSNGPPNTNTVAYNTPPPQKSSDPNPESALVSIHRIGDPCFDRETQGNDGCIDFVGHRAWDFWFGAQSFWIWGWNIWIFVKMHH